MKAKQSSAETTRTTEFGSRQALLDLAISRLESHTDTNADSVAARLSQVYVGQASHAFVVPCHPFVTVKAIA